MFQIGDLIKNKDNQELTRVTMITKINQINGRYNYYMLCNPSKELEIGMFDAHDLCHVVQR